MLVNMGYTPCGENGLFTSQSFTKTRLIYVFLFCKYKQNKKSLDSLVNLYHFCFNEVNDVKVESLIIIIAND